MNRELTNSMIDMLQNMLDGEWVACLKSEAFYQFAQKMFGVRANNTSYILTVLRHPGFLNHMCFFISTRYGQAVFSFGLIEALILSKLDEVYFTDTLKVGSCEY